MKKRIKIDSAILSLVIILTGFLYGFPEFYSSSHLIDNVMDFFGFLCILKGIVLRMAARGFKKVNSNKGHGLVTTGLYRYIRNPMYLGSFLLGCGFVLIVWPWWALPVFALLFYSRFKKQVAEEEKHLEKMFGEEYIKYCKKVPRVFPKFKNYSKMNLKKTLPWDELWNTKEKRGLVGWPVLAVLLETFQEKIIFDVVDIKQTVLICVFAMILFVSVFWYRYSKS